MESGEVCTTRLEHDLKAPLPILFIVLGNSAVRRLSQILYLQPVITQYFASNKSEIWS